jgi:xanthine dehydrogenase small subunit
MRDFVLIYVNGIRREVRGERVFQPLASFLRYDLPLTGTKVVCAEGDCGSCAVLIGRADGAGAVSYRAVTSCIQFVYQLDGAHVVTVEGLKTGGQLNPVQQALVRCQGAQCGFCTPGFVVAMCGMLEEQPQLDDRTLRAGLTGNLCRCTGYEPILRAGEEVPGEQVRRLNELYPPGELHDSLRQRSREPVHVRAGEREFFKPTSIDQATEFRATREGCVIVAGATDVGVQVNKGLRDPKVILSLAGLADLRSIELDDGTLIVGALATLTDLERRAEALCLELAQMLWRHGSPLIRNAGTLAGNIANASPIGDSMPALFVLNSEIELTGRSGARRVNINDFYTGYRRTVMAADELITRVFIPLPKTDETFRLYKVSKRHDLDISTFTAAFWMRRENGAIGDIRIAYGGCGPVIYRLRKTEAALVGKPLNEAEFDSAAEIARQEISPISDVRGDADFRFQLAENVVRKFYFDASGIETYQRITPPGGSRPRRRRAETGR